MKVLRVVFPNFPKASCKGKDPELFHGDDKRDREPHPSTVVICAMCEHKSECLQWALEHGETGTWGGTTTYQRAALKRVRHRVQCPACSGYDIYVEGPTEICLSCGTSWRL